MDKKDPTSRWGPGKGVLPGPSCQEVFCKLLGLVQNQAKAQGEVSQPPEDKGEVERVAPHAKAEYIMGPWR